MATPIRTAATIVGLKDLFLRLVFMLTAMLAAAMLIAVVVFSRGSTLVSANPQEANPSSVALERPVEGDSDSRLAPNALQVTAQAAEDAAAKTAEAVRKANQ
jgi:hypothetical protein